MKTFTLTTALVALTTTTALAQSELRADDMMPEDIIAAAEAADLGETIKIAYIDPLSGPFGPVGDAGLKGFQFDAERINATGGLAGHRLEVVGYDNKTNPKESLVQLQKAIDDGIRVVTQGNGSSVAHALVDAIDKHNRRNPGDEVLFLNYAAVDPALTNEDCSYWHFRFDANTDMKMNAVTDWMATQDDIKKVYIIGQDYSHGRAVAAATRSMLEEKAPDVEIVGDELHPIGKVKDFAPYIQKIIASEADAIVTGNWGTDMTLLVKAAADAGMEIPILTFYAGGLGSPTAMGEGAVGRVKQITEFHENLPTTDARKAMFDYFENELGFDHYYGRVPLVLSMFDKAVDEVGSLDIPAIASTLEGMTLEGPYGTMTMRADDHQAIQPLFLSTLSADVERDVEGTGWGFATDVEIAAADTAVESSCEMQRP